ncbi:hypothetical protein ANTQUA_LOCUS9587 [Anthophora quadrimaculata]
MTCIGRSDCRVYKGIHQKARASFSSSLSNELISKNLPSLSSTMKCFFAVVLLALFAVAFAAETPDEPQNVQQSLNPADPNAPRDKRGVLLSYTAPIAYTSYASAPLAYSAHNVPYAYRSYPYYYNSYYYG